MLTNIIVCALSVAGAVYAISDMANPYAGLMQISDKTIGGGVGPPRQFVTWDPNFMTTVIDHVLDRLRDIGIADISGVPGDYSFPINDAICNSRDIRCSPLMTFRPRE